MLIELSGWLSHIFKARECLFKLALVRARRPSDSTLLEGAPYAELDVEYAVYDIEKPVIFDRQLIEKRHRQTPHTNAPRLF
jgi:hypothetical protein